MSSRRHPGLFWTLDDSGPGVLWAVDAAGALRGRVDVPGGLGRDREALDVGPCGDTDCLYVSDVGDNAEVRTSVRVYRFPEPAPGDDTTSTPEVFRLSLPDGPRDVEAAFLLPGERLHLVTKGVHGAPVVYRTPGPLSRAPSGADTSASTPAGTMVEVQSLGTAARALPDRITGADAASDGTFVLIRTYRRLGVHPVRGDTLSAAAAAVVDLLTLREPQGEGVALAAEGRVVLTGEAGPLGRRGSIAILRCGAGFFR